MKLAQLVLGPAGVGKSTYCEAIEDHCKTIGRTVHVVNMDPAAEDIFYPVSADIRELITITDVTEAMNLGPNGGLVYCMEYFETHMSEWLDEVLEGYGDDDYLVFDCPGQTELYSHLSVFHTFMEYLQNDGWSVCAAYCLDAQFMTDVTKFVGGCFQALSAMVHLEVPHLNVITKMDLCIEKDAVEDFLTFDKEQLLAKLSLETGTGFSRLNSAVADLVEDFNLVNFIPLNITDPERYTPFGADFFYTEEGHHSIQNIVLSMDEATQFGEDRDFRTRDF